MENNEDIELGYLEIFSWEHLALTEYRYCDDVNRLKWLLPNKSICFFQRLMTLQQELILSNCVPLDPLVDHSKRRLFLKAKSFNRPLTECSYGLWEELNPLVRVDAVFTGHRSKYDWDQIYFKDDFKLKFCELEGLIWDEYVKKNAGYRSGGFNKTTKRGSSYSFWVPGMDDKVGAYYQVAWRKHFYENEILGELFGSGRK